LHGFLDRNEIVVGDNEIRIVFSDVTASTHAEANVSKLESFGIGDRVPGHGNEPPLVSDTINQYVLLFRTGTSQDLEVLLDLVELLLCLKVNLEVLFPVIPLFQVRPDAVNEPFSSVATSLQIIFVEKAAVDGDSLSCFDVVSS
jgi:hypothetical protein